MRYRPPNECQHFVTPPSSDSNSTTRPDLSLKSFETIENAMALSEAQEDAARQRIIKHMNADHHDSVCEP